MYSSFPLTLWDYVIILLVYPLNANGLLRVDLCIEIGSFEAQGSLIKK